ncbi:MAG: hypothetical protein ACI8TL_001573, partial [Natronomonas sp.]
MARERLGIAKDGEYAGSERVSLAGATERFLFDIDFANGRREIHHAAFVITVFQAERV